MAWDIQETIRWYGSQGAPGDQNALIGLLREVQKEYGGAIPEGALAQIAASLPVRESILRALIRRLPSLRIQDGHVLELCAGPNCGRHTALADCAEALRAKGANFQLKYVPCMRLCGKGPNIRWNGKLYNGATERLIKELTQGKE